MLNPGWRIRRGEHQFIAARLDGRLMPYDGVLLGLVEGMGPCNQDALGAQMELDRGRVARMVARLEENGLLTRSVNPENRREKQVELTAAGRAALADCRAAYREWQALCYAGFSDEERAQYQAFLTRIAHNISQAKQKGWKNG